MSQVLLDTDFGVGGMSVLVERMCMGGGCSGDELLVAIHYSRDLAGFTYTEIWEVVTELG